MIGTSMTGGPEPRVTTEPSGGRQSERCHSMVNLGSDYDRLRSAQKINYVYG